MSEQDIDVVEEDEVGKRFVVDRVLNTGNRQSFRVPLMAFDTKERAKGFCAEEAQWMQSIPPAIMNNVLARLGIVSMGLGITVLNTPDGVRRIEIAHALPPTNGQGRILKP